MAALGLNMKGKAEKEKTVPAKPKKKQGQKVLAKSSVAKELQAKKAAAKPTSAPLKEKRAKRVTKVAGKVVVQKKVEKEVTIPQKKSTTSKTKTGAEPVYKLRNASLIVEPSKRKKIRKTKVIMEGDLNINNVDGFIQQIKPLFDDYDFIDFSMREANSLDLSYLQMLYYFQNHFVKKGKTVTIDADLTPEFRKIIINNGFKEFMFIPKLV